MNYGLLGAIRAYACFHRPYESLLVWRVHIGRRGGGHGSPMTLAEQQVGGCD